MTTDRHLPLARLAAASVRGDAPSVLAAARDALAAGCAEDEVREALRMVHLFAGFPRALDACASAAPALGRPRPEPEPADEGAAHRAFRERGRRLFDRVYGPDAPKVHERLVALDPELTAWVLEDAYGRVLSREALPPAQRERLAVVLLASQGLRNQLSGHVRGALRCGATPAEVEASLAEAAPWIGSGDLEAARTALRKGLGSG